MPPSTPKASEPKPTELLPVKHVAQVERRPQEQRWLIESLWLASGVGIVGGQPKVCKTFLAAEIALAIAGGTSLFEHPATSSGPVLFFGAEDSLSALRERFEGLAQVRKLSLLKLPIYLIDLPVLRLDRPRHLRALRATVEKYSPRLLVLDPFVRLARVDENSAADVSAVLASLRAIQRDYDVAVLLVHHARKSPAAHPHQALRGSSDFAAWSDSNLYLLRQHSRLTLFVEHRSAPSLEPLHLQLRVEPAPHLVLSDAAPALETQPDPLQNLVLEQLTRAARPLSTTELRDRLRKRKADVLDALQRLLERGAVLRSSAGWAIAVASL